MAAALSLAVSLHGRPAAPRVTFSRYILDNGLRLIVSEDHTAPRFAMTTAYRVGTRDEPPALGGLAHLAEHARLGEALATKDGQPDIRASEGFPGGSTGEEVTTYGIALPSAALDVALAREAAALRTSVISTDTFNSARNAVIEEYENMRSSGGAGALGLTQLAFRTPALAHDSWGSPLIMQSVRRTDVERFLTTHYAPDNAAVVIVGDVDTDIVVARVKHYFGSIPRRQVARWHPPAEPRQTAERRITITDASASSPVLMMGFHVPRGVGSTEYDALKIVRDLAAERLQRTLVQQRRVASQVVAHLEYIRGPGQFKVVVSALPGQELTQIERLVREELQQIAISPVTSTELAGAKNRLRRRQLERLSDRGMRASDLAHTEALFEDADIVNTSITRVLDVTSESVSAVAKSHFAADNRSVVFVVPPVGQGRVTTRGGL